MDDGIGETESERREMNIQTGKVYRAKMPILGFEGDVKVTAVAKGQVHFILHDGSRGSMSIDRFLEYFEEAGDDQDRADQ